MALLLVARVSAFSVGLVYGSMKLKYLQSKDPRQTKERNAAKSLSEAHEAHRDPHRLFVSVDAMIEGARIRLNGWQQAAVALGSAVGALVDPRRADLIAALGETTGKPAFERVLERMKKSPEGRAVLSDRPRVISSKVEHAWELPANTFGAAYARFMGSRNFSPDDRPPVRFMETEELAYVAMRAREVHDFWHTLFGLPTNLIGESALKVIEFEQMMLPMCLLSVVGGTAKFNEKQRALFYQHYFPWACRAGLRCTDLMCVYYEQHFHEDLEDVRRQWGIIPAPAPK